MHASDQAYGMGQKLPNSYAAISSSLSGRIHIDNIEGTPNITCKTPNGATVHSGANVSCSKDADTTVQVTMNTGQIGFSATDAALLEASLRKRYQFQPYLTCRVCFFEAKPLDVSPIL